MGGKEESTTRGAPTVYCNQVIRYDTPLYEWMSWAHYLQKMRKGGTHTQPERWLWKSSSISSRHIVLVPFQRCIARCWHSQLAVIDKASVRHAFVPRVCDSFILSHGWYGIMRICECGNNTADSNAECRDVHPANGCCVCDVWLDSVAPILYLMIF